MTCDPELLEILRGLVLDALRQTFSTKQMRALGWARVDGGRDKRRARYTHRDGWTLEHCGHATAIYPYLLRAPNGHAVLVGACFGNPPNIEHGRAWSNLASAMTFVAMAPPALLEQVRAAAAALVAQGSEST